MNTPQYVVQQYGRMFIFYDDDDHSDVETMLDYVFYLKFSMPNLQLRNRVLFVGDSNMRRAFEHEQENFDTQSVPITVDALGGRRAKDLQGMLPTIAQYRFVAICVGGNDFNKTSSEQLLKYYQDLIGHLPYEGSYYLRVISVFSRKDNDADQVRAFNKKMRETLGDIYYPNHHVNRCHFIDSPERERCHLQERCYHKLISLMKEIANNMFYNFHNRPCKKSVKC